MEAYVFTLSVDDRQTYVEEVLAVSEEDANHIALDALAAINDAHPWTTALSAGDGRVPWLMTAGNRKKDQFLPRHRRGRWGQGTSDLKLHAPWRGRGALLAVPFEKPTSSA